MPAAQSPKDNTALIGGIVGGAIALVLVGALIAFCVSRKRQGRQSKDIDAGAQQLASTPLESNYGCVPPEASTPQYDKVPLATPNHYDHASSPLKF